jgi:hypothetical protein
MKLYVMRPIDPEVPALVTQARLVQADNRSQAFRHTAEATWTCELADPLEAVKLSQAGVQVEQAKVVPAQLVIAGLAT